MTRVFSGTTAPAFADAATEGNGDGARRAGGCVVFVRFFTVMLMFPGENN